VLKKLGKYELIEDVLACEPHNECAVTGLAETRKAIETERSSPHRTDKPFSKIQSGKEVVMN